jgi:hypothetical protein
LYNLFDNVFENTIRKALDDKMCGLASDGINKAANRALGSLPGETDPYYYALIRHGIDPL